MFIGSMWRDENDLIEIGNLDNELYKMDEICWHGWNWFNDVISQHGCNYIHLENDHYPHGQ